jgi:hypothetical protein
MKRNAFVVATVVVTFALALVAKATDASVPHYWCDTLAPVLQYPHQKIVVSFADQIVQVEGQQSMPYSSVRGESDYFVIPTSNANGGRILRMTPFSTSDSRPWYGIEETNIVFIDHLTGEIFRTPLIESTNELGGKIHLATVEIDGMNIYALVLYTFTPRYPAVVLTWGIGATFGATGSEIDNMICPALPPIIPSNSVTTVELLRKAKGTGKFAHVLHLEQPLHAGHRLEYSDKGAVWMEIPRDSLYFTLDLTEVIFRDIKRRKYFRVVW